MFFEVGSCIRITLVLNPPIPSQIRSSWATPPDLCFISLASFVSLFIHFSRCMQHSNYRKNGRDTELESGTFCPASYSSTSSSWGSSPGHSCKIFPAAQHNTAGVRPTGGVREGRRDRKIRGFTRIQECHSEDGSEYRQGKDLKIPGRNSCVWTYFGKQE